MVISATGRGDAARLGIAIIRGLVALIGGLDVVLGPVGGDVGDGLVDGCPGLEPRLGGRALGVSGIGEVGEDFAGAVDEIRCADCGLGKGLLGLDLPRCDHEQALSILCETVIYTIEYSPTNTKATRCEHVNHGVEEDGMSFH